MSHTVLFPGTFDPITNGHLDIIHRASRLFSQLIIGVAADTRGKTPLFDLTERQALVKLAVEKYSNVKVVAFHGLTINCAKEQGAQAILRGLRSGDDLAVEQQMAVMNRQMVPDIDTVFLITTPEHFHISATLVRQIAQWRGDVSKFVPPHVASALVRRFESQ